MPLICYVHNGNYMSVDGVEGCQHDKCLDFKNFDPPKHISFVTVPGGHNYDNTDYKFRATFDKGLNEYKKARDEGLQPKTSTVEGVAAARAQVQSQKRALKRLGMDSSEVKVAPGVD